MRLPRSLTAQSWTARFSITSGVAILVLIAIAWVVFGFGSLGLNTSATIALSLGILLTAGLGVGLMALVFYSNRSGQDDLVQRSARER